MFSSCKEGKKELVEVKVSNEFKLDFLNEILSDTSESRYFKSKVQLVSNFAYMIRDVDFLEENIEEIKFNSLVEYKADILNTKDTLFIKNQIEDNKKLDLNNLSNYGYKIFDFKKCLMDNINYDSIYKRIELTKIRNGLNLNSTLLMIDKPTFNKELNLAYIRFQEGSGGETVLFEKKNNKWKFKEIISSWVE